MTFKMGSTDDMTTQLSGFNYKIPLRGRKNLQVNFQN